MHSLYKNITLNIILNIKIIVKFVFRMILKSKLEIMYTIFILYSILILEMQQKKFFFYNIKYLQTTITYCIFLEIEQHKI